MSLPTPPYEERALRWSNSLLYANSTVFNATMHAEGTEFDAARAAIADVLDQFFVDTASWGLSRWESEMGLNPRVGASDVERREAIRARLRGSGTATIKLIKSVASSYAGGDVNVIEDHETYTIVIQFVDVAGVPANQADIQNALREVIQANLKLVFEFRYSTWDRLDAADLTWDELDALALDWDAFDVYFV